MTVALLDCNNFYVSCERVFQPQLHGRPVVVLSNNDGCIIARSNEAKRLGIAMGAPYYQCRALIHQYRMVVFSSNYALYADMSARVMQSLRMLLPEVEVYSIDEAFVCLQGDPDPLSTMRGVKTQVERWTGIPLSCGIAPSKTLAKLANRLAKKSSRGLCDLRDRARQNLAMQALPVEDLWGISQRLGQRLRALGVHTALDLSQANPQLIRSHLGVVLERMVHELRGHACLVLEQMAAKKSIMRSRAFATPQMDLEAIMAALSCHAARACEKLRAQNSRAQSLCVFLRTHPFRSEPQSRQSASHTLAVATADSPRIIRQAKSLLKQLYRPGYRYHKCGILLMDLQSAQQQTDFFNQPDDRRSLRLMQTVDGINQNMGKNTLFYAGQGTHRPWQMRAKKRSARFTTHWQELLKVH